MRTSPTFNGCRSRSTTMRHRVRSALWPDERMLVLGTEWSVRAYDRTRGAVAGSGRAAWSGRWRESR